MSEHTPGPWKVIDACNLTQVAAGSRDDGTVKGIADLFDSNDGIPEWRSNARLIAAAPDLLAALKQLTFRAHLSPEDAWIETAALTAIAKVEE